MRKLNSFLLLLFAAMMATPGVNAQTDAEYEAAMGAINDGGVYRIMTNVRGTSYYVTLTGGLTSVKDNAGFFTLTKSSGGAFKSVGIRIDTGSERFTNPPLANNVANLNPGNFAHSTNDRGDWERQVFFLNEDGKYAIRSCNTQPATSSWGDAGRTLWTYTVAEAITPSYSYDPAYVWELDGPLTPVNVTYKLVDPNNTEISKTVVKQEANSSVNVPASLVSNFLYEYSVEGTIGDTDSEITITRTMKNGVVHTLEDLSNQKAYTIGCERGLFLTKNDYLASNIHNSLQNAEPTDFAVINYENYYYLYSVTDKKFVTNNGSLSDMPVNGVYDAISMTPKADPLFLYCFQINETTQYGLNTNGNDPYGYVINTWVTPDAGNQYFMIVNDDFDPTDALAALNDFFHPSYFVTYIVKDEAGNEIFKSEAVPTRQGAKITTLPVVYQRPFTKYTEADVTIAEEQTSVEFTATWDGPFQLSTIEDAKWYNMTIRSDYNVFVTEEEPYYPKTATLLQKATDEYQWAFAGNAYTGIMVFNKAKGLGFTLTKDGDAAVMREGQYTWTIGKNADGFTLKEIGTDYNCINQSGGNTGPLKFWNSGNAPTDNGSTFRITAVPTSFEWTIGDAGYATMYLPFNVNVVGNSSVPTAIGAWTFNNPEDLLAGKGIATLQATKHQKGNVTVTELAEAGITPVAGPAEGNGAVIVPKGSSLLMDANINTTDINSYSVLFDICADDATTYIPLLQNSLTDSKDGSLFINKNQIGLGGSLKYNGSIENGKWYRVVFVVQPNGGFLYVDGKLLSGSLSLDDAYNKHWKLTTGALFFADEDGEEKDIKTSEIRFWDTVLTADQVASLGAAGDEIPEINNIEASVATLNGDYMKLNKLDAIVPAATPVVLKAEPGTYKFCVDNSLLNCAKAVEKTNALDDNTITDEDYSVVGYITSTDGKISRDQQVFWMADETDGGKVFEAYWANIPDPTTPLVVGQKVIITGKLQKYVNKSGVVTCEIKNPSVAVLDNDLRGTYEEIDAEGQYVLAKPEGKEVGFYRATSGKIAAYKAYLTLFLNEGTEAKEALLFNAPEDATAIESLAPATTEGDGAIYNIAGQRVNKAQKGIYIVNGKKVLF